MNYLIAHLQIGNPIFKDILIAELAEIGFDGFQEKDSENKHLILECYVKEKDHDQSTLQVIIDRYQEMGQLQLLRTEKMPDKNWNAVWESNFEPVFITDRILIKTPFHDVKGKFEHEILIMPKMAFGTGHHATTSMVMKAMLELQFKERSVLDLGCGTGVLAILAAQLGASNICAVDYDEWAYENTIEHLAMNNIAEVEVIHGDQQVIKGRTFDRILANINLNVITAAFADIVQALSTDGEVLFSGILQTDIPYVMKMAESHQLKHITTDNKAEWAMLHFKK